MMTERREDPLADLDKVLGQKPTINTPMTPLRPKPKAKAEILSKTLKNLEKGTKFRDNREKEQIETKLKLEKAKEKEPVHMTTEPTTPNDSHALMLPSQAKNHYGCIKCEWRGTWMCKYGFQAGKQATCHSSGICQERVNYLLSFSRGYLKRPTFAQWQKDFMLGKASFLERKDYVDMQLLEEVIDKEPDPKEKKRMEKVLEGKRRQWHTLWKSVIDIEDKQVDRDTPKKVEVEHTRTIPISQMQAIMRGDEEVIDVEAKDDTEDNS